MLFKYVKDTGNDAVWMVISIILCAINGGLMFHSYITTVEVLGKVRIIPDDYVSSSEINW